MSDLPAVGPASRSGVRRGGDHYQDLIAWGAALRIVQPAFDFTELEIEIKGVGNVDDVVLRGQVCGDRFGQVKWTANTASLVDEDFLLDRPARGESLLQKFHASYRRLRNPSRPPTLELLTNRSLDRAHPLLGRVDGRTDLLLPLSGTKAQVRAAEQRLSEWADHVGRPVDELRETLEHLQFRPGLTVASERDRAQVLMLAAGLRHDEEALERGLGTVAGWVRGGRRTVRPEDVNAEINRVGLRAGNPRAVLLVQAIDHDPHPEDATESVYWVHLFEGDQPANRCRPHDPADWSTMARDLAAAVQRLESAGWRHILIRGAMRQATFFLVGSSLPAVRGNHLSYIQQGELWATNAARVPVTQPVVRRRTIGAGNDLAVAIGIAMNPGDAVEQYLRNEPLSIGDMIVLTPAEGAHDQVVRGSGEAVAYAQTLRDAIRAELERNPDAEQIHLFLAGPGGLALLLGHRWNRLRPTKVYEHLGVGKGYTPAFMIPA